MGAHPEMHPRHLVTGVLAEMFLCNRKQQVVINGFHSEWEIVKSGVPQGYMLGLIPLVFFIYDLPDEVISELMPMMQKFTV